MTDDAKREPETVKRVAGSVTPTFTIVLGMANMALKPQATKGEAQ